MAKTSEKKMEYDMLYQKEHYEMLSIRLLPKEKEDLKKAAEAAGKSMRRYIMDKVEQDIGK